MQYKIIETYFQTALFQETVQHYFDTVLATIIADNPILQAKGIFEVDGVVKKDYYDMPYHIHILNGLIPSLLMYEQYLKEKGWIEDPKSILYLKSFILGFTFHDANKLLGTKESKGYTDLEIALQKLEYQLQNYQVEAFFPEYEAWKNNIFFLAIGTEKRTSILSGEYAIQGERHLGDIQQPLCNFADGLASIQNENLDQVEHFYEAIQKTFKKINFINTAVSYIKIRPNPYILLSQQLIYIARQVLAAEGKKVLFALRDGFVYWGEPLTLQTAQSIKKAFLADRDVKPLELIDIDYQKCKFGFLGSVDFDLSLLVKIITSLQDKFLLLSPNTRNKIQDFDYFNVFTKAILNAYLIPVEDKILNDKLYLNYSKDIEDDDYNSNFRTIYNLHKLQWLNSKENKKWKKDFDTWVEKEDNLPVAIEFNDTLINTFADFRQFISNRVNSTSALYKVYLNFIKTWQVLEKEASPEDYITQLEKEIIDFYTSSEEKESVKALLFDSYFHYETSAIEFLNNYNPIIPSKKEMCAFTGGKGDQAYESSIAFGMKARGFSNRSVTALNNNTSYISALFAEENKLRSSNFKDSDANLIIYHDFFEASLDINRDIITSSVKALPAVKYLDDVTIEFDKNAKFQYNLFNLEFAKLPPNIESTFFLVRKLILLVKRLGIRSYVTGIMSPYQSHKAAFHFENAPKYIQQLGWDQVRLGDIDFVLEEIKLLLLFGKNQIPRNILRVALSRRAYFRLFYELNEDEKLKVNKAFESFYQQYKNKLFGDMTNTEQLVELAVRLDTGFRSMAEETWLIRTATDYLRTYVKKGHSREDIIQKMAGEIYRKLSNKYKPNLEHIEEFCIAVYDKLYVEDWGGSLPTLNMQKDWIYQFAYLFRRRSLEKMQERKAQKEKQMKNNIN